MNNHSIILAAGVAAIYLGAPALASASAVTTVSVVEPSGIVYVQGFPAPVTVKLSVDARNNPGNCANDGVSRITVGATGSAPGAVRQQILDVEDPVLVDGAGDASTGCPAFYSFVWQVPAADSYDLDVMARRGNIEGTDDEEITIELALVSVEYPAPPAVANAHINSDPNLKSLPGRQRGCVVSMVAGKHAKLAGTLDGYGPKGGPYNEAAIKQDVADFFAICPAR